MDFETTILEDGDNQIHGSAYYDGYLWFSTRTNPARILKMDPDTLEYEKIILGEGFNDGEALVGADGSIFVILHNYPTRIIKIKPDDLTKQKLIKINEMDRGQSLLYKCGYLWAGGAGKLARINISDYSYIIYSYPTSAFHALASGNDGFLWGSCPSHSQTTILRINAANPKDYDSVVIKKIATDDMLVQNGALYVGTENEKERSYIYKISTDLTYVSVKTQKVVKCWGVFRDLWVVYDGNPGTIIKLNEKLVEIDSIISLPSGFNDANEIVFDSKGSMFITCFQSPAKVVKLQMASL